MPVYAEGPNKNFGGLLGYPSNRGFFEEYISTNCRYRFSVEKLVKIDGEYKLVLPGQRRPATAR
jgi:hypothetical protein